MAKVKKEDSDDEEYLYVYTGCMVNKSQMWSVEARSEYSILHPDTSKSYHDEEFVSSTVYALEALEEVH